MASAVKLMILNLKAVTHQNRIIKIISYALKINKIILHLIIKIINKSLVAVKYLNSVLIFHNSATYSTKT